VHMTRRGIAAVLPPEDEEVVGEDDELGEGEMQDESGVTEDEEPVSAVAGDVPPGDDRR
jgi:hypothetical protein